MPNKIPLIQSIAGTKKAVYHASLTFTVDEATETDVGIFDKQSFSKLLFQLKNAGANPITFAFYGINIDDFGDDPPDFSAEEYFTLPQSTGDIAADANTARDITDNWDYILLRVKETTGGSASTLELEVRGST